MKKEFRTSFALPKDGSWIRWDRRGIMKTPLIPLLFLVSLPS